MCCILCMCASEEYSIACQHIIIHLSNKCSTYFGIAFVSYCALFFSSIFLLNSLNIYQKKNAIFFNNLQITLDCVRVSFFFSQIIPLHLVVPNIPYMSMWIKASNQSNGDGMLYNNVYFIYMFLLWCLVRVYYNKEIISIVNRQLN